MDLGYVYTATDYVGLGTPGDPYYMVGASEAQDVVNSVRAAQRFPGSDAGSRYAVMGHSQGGHSALWTGALSEKIAPELELVGVAASAPATQLVPLLEQQWNTMIGWAIGPEVAVSWPTVYTSLAPVTNILTPQGADHFQAMAYECLETAGVQGYVQEALGHQMFASSPASDLDWRDAMAAETPPPLPAELPVMITQAMQDGIVLANTNALTQERWCKAGTNLQFNWLGQLATGPLASAQTHEDTLFAAWPLEVDWMQDRFAGRRAQPNCSFTPPVAPAAQ
jgi:alpha-beta hydrolase superfamily lysophospholipase